MNSFNLRTWTNPEDFEKNKKPFLPIWDGIPHQGNVGIIHAPGWDLDFSGISLDQGTKAINKWKLLPEN